MSVWSSEGETERERETDEQTGRDREGGQSWFCLENRNKHLGTIARLLTIARHMPAGLTTKQRGVKSRAMGVKDHNTRVYIPCDCVHHFSSAPPPLTSG